MHATFDSLHIGKHFIQRLNEMNITEPTPIQKDAVPVIAQGRDIVAQSQTGTGKTLAYTLPLLQSIDPSEKKLQALILVPTRELGVQISQTLEQLTDGSGIVPQALIGGASIQRQIDKLKLHPHIAVGTPGRILELLKLKKLSMHYVRTIVVDEVDQVFELGSIQEVDSVIRSALRDRQLCFFSATIPDAVKDLAGKWMKDPEFVQVRPELKTAETLEHFCIVSQERERIDTLRRLVRLLEPKSGIIFTNEVDLIGEIVSKLQYAGLRIEALYGEAGKQERAKVMKDFREGRLPLLLATDVAARGLDIPGVTHVFNFDLPVDADHYVHRAGRTGRMGRGGTVFSICTPRQSFIIEKFSKSLGIPIAEKTMYEGKLLNPQEKTSWAGKRPVPVRRQGMEEIRRSGTDRPAQEVKNGDPSINRRQTPGTAKRPPTSSKLNADRERDRKNKGAPKWLKEKRQGNKE